MLKKCRKVAPKRRKVAKKLAQNGNSCCQSRKKCSQNLTNCSISKNNNDLVADLNLNILKKATKYRKDAIEKNKKENPYIIGDKD